MKIDITSMFFNSSIEGQTATPAWGTSIGQNKSRGCRIDDFKSDIVEMIIGMTYKSVVDLDNLDVSKGSATRDIITCSVFEDVYINNKKIENTQYVLLLVREHSKSHDGRLLISYAPYIKYNDIENQSCINLMQEYLGCSPEGCWFVYDISIRNQSELHFSAVVVDALAPKIYEKSSNSQSRSKEWKELIPTDNSGQNFFCEPLQQIFYGAPGTGKSNTIKREVDDKNKKKFRVTFHPDSDYSTFVGCYKPKSSKDINRIKQPILDYDSLVDKFKEYLNVPNVNITKVCTVFGFDYHDSILRIQENGHKILDLVNDAYKSNTTYDSVVRGGMACFEKYPIVDNSSKITYEFVPQAFTKAYTEAWNTEEDVYLIIEEINRGNCAQIFGDLFQLLDRKNGVSEYPVDADTDLQNYLSEALAETTRTDIPEDVKSGKKLMLPSNLYIWATMNTSDQSLFPIDSAFKRRWNWKYIKIKNHPECNYQIKVGDEEYDWWQFITKINAIIASMTSSADKQLGYFFCKAKDGEIDEETFVSKVIFYLWNDVFKDYGFEDASLFRYTDKDGVEKDLTFPDFYDENGDNVDTERLADFLKKVMEWKANDKSNDNK